MALEIKKDTVEMPDSPSVENNDRDLEQEKFDTIAMHVVFGFVAWIFLVSMPLILVFEPESVWARTGIMLAYIPLCSWLYFSRSGPGFERVHEVLLKVIKGVCTPVIAVPERIRFWIVAPFFVVATLAMTVHIGYLALSDEVSQKRALFSSYEPGRDVKWFHSGDKIDVFVFSNYMDRKFETQEGEVGVHLTYQGESVMSKTGIDFREMLEADLDTAEYGKVSTQAEAEMAIYKANRNPLSGISYHGAFGTTSVGFIGMIVCTMALFTTLVLLYADRKYRHSGLLALATVLFVFFIYSGQMASNDEDRPKKIAEFTENQSGVGVNLVN